MNIIIKLGTHSLQCVKVCRKRKKPMVGEKIHIKRHHFAKEEGVLIIEIPLYDGTGGGIYRGDLL